MKLFREIREFVVLFFWVVGFVCVYVPVALAWGMLTSATKLSDEVWEIVIITAAAAIAVSLFTAVA